MFVDTHAHLLDPAFDDDREQVRQEAFDGGMPFLVVVGCDPETSAAAAGFAASHPGTWATVGVHPHQAGEHGPEAARKLVERFADHPQVVALGEMGLDTYYDFCPLETQREVFAAQLDRARAQELPVVVHVRDAEEDALELLSTPAWPRGIWHCFAGSRKAADAALEGGMYLSFSGMITYSWAEGIRDVARSVPADRLLVETDSPWLRPRPAGKGRNRPALVEHTGRALAALRGEDPGELAARTTANARRVLGLPAPGRDEGAP